jgi:hypothetical protein
VRLCRLPERQSASLRDELSDHLQARVDDLLVRGMDEQRAAEKAIEELGDAALFAQHYRSERSEPIRRKVMNGILLCGVGAALTLSVASFTMDEPSRENMYIPEGSMYTQEAGEDVRISIDAEEAPLGDIFASFADQLDKPLYVHWDAVGGASGAGPDTKLTLQFTDLSTTTALRFLNDALGADLDRVEYRINDGLLEFGSREYFDRHEQVIVAYELEPFVNYEYEEITGLITSMVEMESWVDNGGQSAAMQIVGETMFVKGPGRIQRGVRWVLRQLIDGGEVIERSGEKLEGGTTGAK